MTGYALILVVCCAGADAQSTSQRPGTVKKAGRTIATGPVDQLRERYRRVMRASALRSRPVPEQVVPELIALYAELRGSTRPVGGLSQAERRRMLGALEGRLKQWRTRLRTDLRREQRRFRANSRAASAVGGGPATRVQELIRLIENTIAPETWEVNGGRGRIMFWPNPPALVIRQTGEVHHQIGAMLGVLRDP